ncbi:MAG: IS3 family transposase [bacterium]|nr:IS3 family transposase [bacterium]
MAKKKGGDRTLLEKRRWIEPNHPSLSIHRQCELLGLARASYYYEGQGEHPENIVLMHRIDQLFTDYPFYGVRKMTAHLCRQGYDVNVKRIRRLMRKMGLEAVYPKPRLSQRHPEHRVYPYLLRDLPITTPNQVWCTDITYIRLLSGFVYLVAIMDWFSRYVLSWELSISLDTEFCLIALERALQHTKPAIFNSDQGCQFTSQAFTGKLTAASIAISMDGRGRAYDKICIPYYTSCVRSDRNAKHSLISALRCVDDISFSMHFVKSSVAYLVDEIQTQLYSPRCVFSGLSLA